MIIERAGLPFSAEAASLRPPGRLEWLLAACALAAGVLGWIAYSSADLVLVHYDARAHLVVARRTIDSLTPGWKQIGAVWLPLPHLINALPAQIDVLYRTGLFASGVSIACLGVTVWTAARLIRLMTGSAFAAALGAGLLLLNPNLLYLHVTPMTEPLLLAASFVLVLWMYEWTAGNERAMPRRIGVAAFAAMWTRYEAWPVVAAAVAAALYAMWRRGWTRPILLAQGARLAAWPLAAVLIFVLNSRLTTGDWFVSGGFYELDPLYEGQPLRGAVAVWWGTHRLSGYVLESAGLLAAAVMLVGAVRRRRHASHLIPLALLGAALLPFYAFYQGHPFRMRYMLMTTAACTVFAALGAGWLGRRGGRLPGARAPAALEAALGALVLVSMLAESPPLGRGPMLEEAMWDAPSARGRAQVTDCLARGAVEGDKIVASMGSLAHYMHELSASGFDIADFIHEGNGAIWEMALDTGPAAHAAWMLAEEQSEGGDVLAQRLRRDPSFGQGMMRVCEGGGVALYRRTGGAAPPRGRGKDGGGATDPPPSMIATNAQNRKPNVPCHTQPPRSTFVPKNSSSGRSPVAL